MKDRKTRFAELMDFVRARNGWITSIPGATEVTVETLSASALPDELRGLGYVLAEIGDGERILPTAITEPLCLGADGALEPMTTSSTRAVASTTAHAGIVKARRYSFSMC